jgi:hypothetical protein
MRPTTKTSTSRRTLVRAAAHSAWAVPVVSAASAAPASAATSGAAGTQLVVESAQFWVVKATKGNGRWWVVPQIVIRNPGSDSTSFPVFTMHFPTSDFVGVVPTAHGLATPSFNNIGGLYGPTWGSESQTPTATENTLAMTVYSPLAPGSRLTLGTGPVSNPGALAWYNNPTVSSIAFEVSAGRAGFAVTAGSMARAAPTS